MAVDLSIDQTPFRSDELERVKMCGARVLTMDQIEGLKNPDVQKWCGWVKERESKEEEKGN